MVQSPGASCRCVAHWQELLTPERLQAFRPELLNRERFEAAFVPIAIGGRAPCASCTTASATPTTSSASCAGSSTNVWCVAASVQMLLDFYRYTYEQTRIAAELGLVTLSSLERAALQPGWPGCDGDRAAELERARRDHGTGHRRGTSLCKRFWLNRPLISFVPGHSRTVAGFTQTELFGWYLFRGLLVYDPGRRRPAGRSTRWENFGVTTYRVTHIARLHFV